MRGGYSLDETHIPEIVACLIPALASSDDYDAAAKTDPSLSRVASLESVTDNALLIGNSEGETYWKLAIFCREIQRPRNNLRNVQLDIKNLYFFTAFAHNACITSAIDHRSSYLGILSI